MGFKIDTERLNEINYADDEVLIAKTPQQMQLMIAKLNEKGKKYSI